MPNRNSRNNRRAMIPIKVRKVLIDLIINKNVTYMRASKRLRIKLSTAKVIVKRFKERGTLFDPFSKKDLDPEFKETSRQRSQEVENQNRNESSIQQTEQIQRNVPKQEESFPFMNYQVQSNPSVYNYGMWNPYYAPFGFWMPQF